MRILFLSSEVGPYSKSGGLGDVSGALPSAMAALGHDVCVVTPLYRSVKAVGFVAEPQPLTLTFPFGEVEVHFTKAMVEPRYTVVLVDVPAFFDRQGYYGFADDARRFTAFTLAGLSWAQRDGFDADVVWCNDWPTGLGPLALKSGYSHTPLGRAKTVFTIHNLAYMGNFPPTEMEALGIPWSRFTIDGVEFYHQLGFLKAALRLSDVLTTVSPTYAAEIQTKEGGVGFEGLLRTRANQLHGILNGVDVREWNPATDVLLPARFSASELSGRAVCRDALFPAFGIDPPVNGMPVFGAVGRMVGQKGADLMQAALPRFLERGGTAVILGSGEPDLERTWRSLRARFPRRLGLRIGFDNALAHLVEAGCDFFLMPSRFEPCGLNQMYSLLYGAVPVVRAVGGLQDTVRDVSEPDGTGIVFGPPTEEALTKAMMRAVDLFQDEARLRQVQVRGMSQDFSWSAAARKYEALLR